MVSKCYCVCMENAASAAEMRVVCFHLLQICVDPTMVVSVFEIQIKLMHHADDALRNNCFHREKKPLTCTHAYRTQKMSIITSIGIYNNQSESLEPLTLPLSLSLLLDPSSWA